MAFDRAKAKGSVQDPEQNDAELSEAITEGHKAYAEIAQIKNKHEIDKANIERGWIGRVFGSWQNVPMFIALLSVLFGMLAFWKFMGNALAHESDKVFWSEAAKLALAFASTAVGYIFGRGSKSDDNP